MKKPSGSQSVRARLAALKKKPEPAEAPVAPPKAWYSEISLSVVISVCGLLGSFITIYFSSSSVVTSNKWRKAEFLTTEHEQFMGDTSVRMVNNAFERFQGDFGTTPAGRSLTLDDLSLALEDDSALLATDTLSAADLANREKVIDLFESYLQKLAKFRRFQTSGLYSKDELQPYILPQVANLSNAYRRIDADHWEQFRNSLWGYIDRRHYEEIQELCYTYGHDITPDQRLARRDSSTGFLSTVTHSLKKWVEPEPEAAPPDTAGFGAMKAGVW